LTVQFQVILGASSPLVLIEIWYLELWGDDNVRHQT